MLPDAPPHFLRHPTMRRYVAPVTLHLLGVLTLPLMALPLLAFLVVGAALRRGPRWTIGSVLAASAAAVL